MRVTNITNMYGLHSKSLRNAGMKNAVLLIAAEFYVKNRFSCEGSTDRSIYTKPVGVRKARGEVCMGERAVHDK